MASHRQRAHRQRDLNKLRCKVYVSEYLLAHPCIECGESDIVVLECDHRGDKLDGIGKILSAGRFNAMVEEIKKCDVRCANCHRRKHLLNSYRAKSLESLRTELADSKGTLGQLMLFGV